VTVARGAALPPASVRGRATIRNIAATAYIATRVEPREAEALQEFADHNAHNLSAEFRQAIRRHLAPAASLEDERQAGPPGATPTAC
jgi:hypothetical protein